MERPQNSQAASKSYTDRSIGIRPEAQTSPNRRRKRSPGDPQKAVGYLRVSTEEQSLEAQRDAITAWAAREGVQVVAWCEDRGTSGAAALDQREGLMEAYAALEEYHAGIFVVAKHDRLARSSMIAGMVRHGIEKLGATYVSACGTGNGDGPEEMLMRAILEAFAEYERFQIKRRTSAGLQAKRGRGITYSGIAPYGYRNVGKELPLEPVLEEQGTLTLIRELLKDSKSLRDIQAQLNQAGRLQRNGKPWQFAMVQRLVNRLRQDSGHDLPERTAGGLRKGVKPYGTLEGEEEGLAALLRLARKRGGKRRSAAAIATELDELGHQPRSGEAWSRSSVRSVLARHGK